MKLEDLLDRLEGVKPAGNGYNAICPAHDDSQASLGVTESSGKILLNCYAGCDYRDVLDALDLKSADLKPGGVRYDEEPEAIYCYTDETGYELFQAVRFPGKRFRQRYMGPDGEWVWNLEGVRRVPFELDLLIAEANRGGVAFVVEGEKDVQALMKEGKVATCNPMGAGKWKPEFAKFFQGLDTVIIVADRDEPGRQHAAQVKASLEGIVPKVWVMQAKTGKDVSDHLAAGHRLEDLRIVRDYARRGIVKASEMAEAAREDLLLTEHDLPGFVILPEVARDLVLRQGRMYALGAYTGDGKTTIALQATRTLCTAGVRGGYFTLEMPERDLRNKLLAHRGIPLQYTENPWLLRARPDLLSLHDQAVEELSKWELDVIFDSNLTSEKAESYIRDGDYQFVIVDHIHRFGRKDRTQFEETVRKLTNLALEANIMVLVLCQLRKSFRGKDLEAYPRPSAQDFRDTSQIADDASMALAVWRQRDALGLTYTGESAQLIVLKNRHTTGRSDAAGRVWMADFDQQHETYIGAGGTV